MKKISSLTVIFAMLLALLLPSAGLADDPINVIIDGKEQIFDVNPVVENGRTLVPLRGVFEELGTNVSWDKETSAISLTKLGTEIELKIGSDKAIVNGKEMQMDEPAQLLNGRTLVPLRFIVENLSAKVHWDKYTNTATITSLEKWLLQKSIEVELNSYSMEMLMDQKMAFAEEIVTMSMTMYADLIEEPMQMYAKTVMDMLGQEVVSESYLTSQGYYVSDPSLGGWVKYPDEMLSELLELSAMTNNDPLAQLDLMIEHVDELIAIEKDDYYQLTMTISNEGFAALMSDVLGMLEMFVEGESQEDIFAGITIEEFKYVTYYDKDTFYPAKIEGTTVMEINADGEKMRIEQSIIGLYSNFNEISPIEIPQEVIDKAVNLEDIDFESMYEIE